jgi:hypothetical protein
MADAHHQAVDLESQLNYVLRQRIHTDRQLPEKKLSLSSHTDRYTTEADC